jgi:hypothetical protein
MVSDLRYGWKKLRKQGIEVSGQLAEMQVNAGCCNGLTPDAACINAADRPATLYNDALQIIQYNSSLLD